MKRFISLLVCLLCPAQGALSDAAVRRLTSVAYVRSVGGVCGRPAGWHVLADWGPARSAWLKAAAARFRCRYGRGISWRPPAYSLVFNGTFSTNKLCGRPPQYAHAPCKLIFDLWTLKVVSESRVTWATSVPILVFLGLSVLDLGPIYATDRRQTSDAHHRLMHPTLGEG